jgi:hypothetical protein
VTREVMVVGSFQSMFRRVLLGLLVASSQNHEALAQSKNVQDAIGVIVMFCVAGGEKFEVSGAQTGDGALSLKKEGEADADNITISKSEARGLVDGIRVQMNNVTANQASEARKCMQPYIDRILDTLLGSTQTPPSAPTKPNTDQSGPPNQSPESQNVGSLLRKISIGRWCTLRRTYSLKLAGTNIIWTDSLGSIDMERVVYDNVGNAQTITQKSIHSDGNPVPVGTTWTYFLSGGDKIDVSKNGGKAFSLRRC